MEERKEGVDIGDSRSDFRPKARAVMKTAEEEGFSELTPEEKQAMLSSMPREEREIIDNLKKKYISWKDQEEKSKIQGYFGKTTEELVTRELNASKTFQAKWEFVKEKFPDFATIAEKLGEEDRAIQKAGGSLYLDTVINAFLNKKTADANTSLTCQFDRCRSYKGNRIFHINDSRTDKEAFSLLARDILVGNNKTTEYTLQCPKKWLGLKEKSWEQVDDNTKKVMLDCAITTMRAAKKEWQKAGGEKSGKPFTINVYDPTGGKETQKTAALKEAFQEAFKAENVNIIEGHPTPPPQPQMPCPLTVRAPSFGNYTNPATPLAGMSERATLFKIPLGGFLESLIGTIDRAAQGLSNNNALNTEQESPRRSPSPPRRTG